ncbi:MAG: hypothetical protein Q7K57_01425 [Burkholderiaceae bacterium]|nr:hypothetical protein [Burkholderiaceae bacterium]
MSDIHATPNSETADIPVTETNVNSNNAANANPPQHRHKPLLDRLQTHALVLMVLCLCFGFLVLAVVFPLAYFWSEKKGKEVESVQSAGRVVAVSQATGLLTRGLVETDTGYYSVIDGVSLNKHESLTLETRGNQARLLCDSQHRCVKLMSTIGVE